jgi:hypothetical protein
MDSLIAAVAEGLIDAVSVHGVYLRQVCLGFEELPFESVTFLWQELCHELDRVSHTRRTTTVEKVESQEEHDNNELSNNWPLSTQQVEEFLQETCRKLDQADFSYERTELEVRSMLERVPEASAAYFLRFMNCLKHKDRTALDALHQFFDHAMIQKQATTKEILQFSAILLALVHDSFGDSTAALMATEEAVRVAQQSKDSTCVAFALGKLFENKGQGTAGRRELLQRCAARASQEQIRQLVTGSSLGLSLDYLRNQQQRVPATIWRHYMEATAEPSADSTLHWDRPTFLSPSPHDTVNSMARQTLVEAGIWNSLGAPGLSGLASLTMLNCHDTSSAEDRISALINLAEQTQHGSPSSFLLGHQRHGTQADLEPPQERLLEARGAHNVAGKSFEVTFLPALILQLHRQCIARRDLETAKAFETMMYSSLPPDSRKSQYALEMGIQTCLRLCRSHDYCKARELVRDLLDSSDLEVAHRVKLLITAVDIELESTNHQYVSALPHLLEAISICEESSMHGLHCVALLQLSRVFLRNRNSKRALSVLQAAMPDILARTSSTHQAEAYLQQAKCYIQWAEGEPTISGPVKQQRYQAALISLQSSERLFQQGHNEYKLTEVYYLQARLWNLQGRMAECEVASQRFLDLQDRASPALITALDSLIPMAMVS